MNTTLVSTSAVPLSRARPYLALFNRSRYAAVFNKYGEGKTKDKFRIYIPATSDHMVMPKPMTPPPALVQYLAMLGMTIDNYAAGTCFLPDGKRITRIGKAVAKDQKIKQLYDQDPQRAATKKVSAWIVISRHPYDIIGMSFDRGWTSCMNIKDGTNRRYLKSDVEAGTLVAYLIKETDKNINAPTARIAIKPFENASNLILIPEQVYGTAPDSFAKVVSKFCTYMNSGAPSGKYTLVKGLYADAVEHTIYHANETDDLTKLTRPERIGIINNDQTSSSILHRLVNDADPAIRNGIAMHENASEETLAQLADDPSKNVRASVADHPNSSAETINKLYKDPVSMVSKTASTHVKLSDEHLAEMMAGSDSRTQTSIVYGRRDIPEAILTAYLDRAFSDDENVRRKAPMSVVSSIGHYQKNQTILRRIFDYAVKYKAEHIITSIAGNSGAPANILQSIYDRSLKNSDILEALAENAKTPPMILEALAVHRNLDIRFSVVSNTHLPTAIALKIATGDKSSEILRNLCQMFAERSDIPVDQLDALDWAVATNKNADEECMVALAMNPRTSARVLRYVAEISINDTYILDDILSNPNTDHDTLVYLAKTSMEEDVMADLATRFPKDHAIIMPILKNCQKSKRGQEVYIIDTLIGDETRLDDAVLAEMCETVRIKVMPDLVRDLIGYKNIGLPQVAWDTLLRKFNKFIGMAVVNCNDTPRPILQAMLVDPKWKPIQRYIQGAINGQDEDISGD